MSVPITSAPGYSSAKSLGKNDVRLAPVVRRSRRLRIRVQVLLSGCSDVRKETRRQTRASCNGRRGMVIKWRGFLEDSHCPHAGSCSDIDDLLNLLLIEGRIVELSVQDYSPRVMAVSVSIGLMLDEYMVTTYAMSKASLCRSSFGCQDSALPSSP